jgi:hypothetical protein
MVLLLKTEFRVEINDLLENAGLSRGCGAGDRWEHYNRGKEVVRKWRDGQPPGTRPRYEAAVRAMCEWIGA